MGLIYTFQRRDASGWVASSGAVTFQLAVGTQGATGAAGPNSVSGTTATTLTGILKGDGSTVGTVTVGSGLTFDGTTLSASGAVSSVFGRAGAVVPASGDYTAAMVTNAADKTAANTFTVGGQVIQTGAAGTVGLCVQGAASQTANLFEARDSSSNILFSVEGDGDVNIRPAVNNATTTLKLGLNNAGSGSSVTIGTLGSNTSAYCEFSSQSVTGRFYGSANTGTNTPRTGAGFGSLTSGAHTTLGCLAASAGGGTYLNFSTNGSATGMHVTHNHGADLLTMTSAGIETLRSGGIRGWVSSSTDANGTPDTALVRSAAGVVGVYDNAAGGVGTAVGLRFQRASSTTAQQDAAHIGATFSDATHATRTGQLTLGAYYTTTLRTGLTIGVNSTEVLVGLFAATPVARSTGWSVTNPVTRKTFDTTTITLPQLAEVVGTLVDYLKTLGPLGA